MKQVVYIILIILINQSCTQPNPETIIIEPLPKSEYLTVPFDTAEVIANLNIVDYMNRLDLIESDTTSGLYDKVDTIICYYNMYPIAFGNNPVWQEIEYKNCTDYTPNYPLHQYYITPVTDELSINKNIHFTNYSSSVMFIGRKYKTAYKEGEVGKDSWAGERFKYYYFELIIPYHVYGPPLKPKNKNIDELIFLTELEVKELQTKKE